MKTPICIGTYLEARDRNIIKGPGLIVVKASLKYQWASEVKKFSHLKPKVLDTYKGCVSNIESKIKRKEKKLLKETDKEVIKSLNKDIKELKAELKETFEGQFKDADIFIANYETLNDSKVKKELHKIKPECVLVDEIHYCKDDKAKRSKSLAEFNYAKIKVGATATPVQRDPRDIFGLYKFICPTLFPKKTDFGALYIRWGGHGRVIGSKNEKLLNQKIQPHMIIKTKEEVAKQLPELVVMQRTCKLEDKQILMTEQLMKELDELREQEKALANKFNEKELLTNEEYNKVVAGIMSRQTFAQELADSEELLIRSESEMAKQYVTKSKSNKLELLVDLAVEIIESGEKLCIFSKYTRMQDIITERFKKHNVLKHSKIAYVNGSISGEDRFIEVYDKFRDNDEYKVLIMSDSGAEGINLSECKYLIEYEPAESYAIQTQRHGRLERADSVHDTVFVYQLIAENSYDEIAQKIVAKKEQYDSTIVKGNSVQRW